MLWIEGLFLDNKLCSVQASCSCKHSLASNSSTLMRILSYADAHSGTYLSTVKHAIRLRTPSFFCRSRASRPRKGTSDLSLHVNARPLSNGVSSALKSSCQWRYPINEYDMFSQVFVPMAVPYQRI